MKTDTHIYCPTCRWIGTWDQCEDRPSGKYTVAADGSIMIVVSFGANTNWEKCLPHELSATKVSDGTDGDEWKENAGA